MKSCWTYFGHDWSKWENMGTELSLINPVADHSPAVCTGYYMVQKRTCSRCGKLQLRKART
jgi:hypothetical protein